MLNTPQEVLLLIQTISKCRNLSKKAVLLGLFYPGQLNKDVSIDGGEGGGRGVCTNPACGFDCQLKASSVVGEILSPPHALNSYV